MNRSNGILEGQPTLKLPDNSPSPMHLQPFPPSTPRRNGQVSMATFSPVNENGSFAFDRVLKTGKVHRRIKHKHVSALALLSCTFLTLTNIYQAFRASWKPGHLVLRPNLLSVYKDEEATRLKLSITLSEVTAVAPFKSPRSKREHLFAVYCSSKNYRFQAASQKDAEDWIQRIRSETRLDEEEAALLALSKKDQAESAATKRAPIEDATDLSETDAVNRPSSPELGASLSPNTQAKGYAYPPDYSANDMTSEWSDGPSTGPNLRSKRSANNLSSAAGPKDGQASLPRENSRNADLGVLRDPERVICNGYLQCLRTKGGVRQWKRYWVVLRPKSLGFYKDDQVSTTSIEKKKKKKNPFREKLTGMDRNTAPTKSSPCLKSSMQQTQIRPRTRKRPKTTVCR